MSELDFLSARLKEALLPFHPGVVTAAFFFAETAEPGFAPGPDRPARVGLFLSVANADNLRKLIGFSRDFRRQSVQFPLVLTEEFIENSLDSFALEFIEFRQYHRMILGNSPFNRRTPDLRSVRLQCEHELRSVGLHLKSALLQAHTDSELAMMLEAARPDFTRLALGLLTLKGAAQGVRRAEVIVRAAEQYGLDSAIFARVANGGYPGQALLPFYEQLLGEIEKLSGLVDSGRL